MRSSIYNYNFVVLVLLFGGAAVAAVAQAQPLPSAEPTQAGFATLATEDLAQILPTKTFMLVNVHVPYEGHIEQTDAFIPFDKITDHLSKLPADKSASIILYCMSGRMSEIAAEALSNAGYSNVSHVAGGMIDWAANGYAVLDSQTQR